jgi:SH3-like domain-containing protein
MNRLRYHPRSALARLVFAAAVGLLGAMPIPAALAQATDTNGQTIGGVSGLPVPRFVSLKADRVNLREGPSKDHRTTWIYERAGLPVEITAEFGMWRKVRDSDGTEGWVLHNLLSGRRTALVAPWKKDELFTLYTQPAKDSPPLARLQPGVIGNIKTCDGSWCEIYGDGFDGFIQQNTLWGVYPNEKID